VKITILRLLSGILAVCALLAPASAQSGSGKNSNGPPIDGIYLYLRYGLGYGGAVQITYEPYLLLKDGTIYRNLQAPPQDLDIGKSRQAEPKMWGRWQKSGNSIMVQWEDGKRETWEKDWHVARPARKTDRLQGRFRSMSGGGNTALGGSTSIAVTNDIVFSADGSFRRGDVVSAKTDSVTVGSKRKGGGTYLIDGYSIELRYDDGQVERLTFYFYPDGNTVIGIGNRVFVLRQ
jgi:hypothetical protein